MSKIVYQTDATGVYVGEAYADSSPLEPGVWLIPAGCVETAPPALSAGQMAVWKNGSWTVEAVPSPPSPTPAQVGQAAYNAAILAGIQIASTATPSLNGTYYLDDSTQIMLLGEANYISLAGTFSNGTTTRTWKDTSSNVHVFPNTTSFLAFAKAVAKYINDLETAWMECAETGTWTAPTLPVTIP